MYKELELKIKGISPLMLHNGQLANPLNSITKAMKRVTSKRIKTDEDHELLAKLEWLGGLYTTEPMKLDIANSDVKIECTGQPCIPGELIEATILSGARKHKLGQQCQAGIICDGNWPIKHDGPKSVPGLWEDGRFVDVRKVKVQKNSVMRSRPVFHNWSLEFTVHYLPSLLNESQVIDILTVAGAIIGLAEYRPKFGRFQIV